MCTFFALIFIYFRVPIVNFFSEAHSLNVISASNLKAYCTIFIIDAVQINMLSNIKALGL